MVSLDSIQAALEAQSIFLKREDLNGFPAVIGYDKRFRWKWVATQLNTFIVCADFGDTPVTLPIMESFVDVAFETGKENYAGWPRGIQCGTGVIAIALGQNITPEAQDYCINLRSGKKWAGFTVPTAVNTMTGDVFKFSKNPMWGKIYYPHFKHLIETTLTA